MLEEYYLGVLNCGSVSFNCGSRGFKLWFHALGVGSSGCCDAICHPQTGLPSREHSCLWMVHRYVMYLI